MVVYFSFNLPHIGVTDKHRPTPKTKIFVHVEYNFISGTGIIAAARPSNGRDMSLHYVFDWHKRFKKIRDNFGEMQKVEQLQPGKLTWGWACEKVNPRRPLAYSSDNCRCASINRERVWNIITKNLEMRKMC